MVPQNLRFGGGVADSVFNPAVGVILVLAGVLILFLPQRKVIIPFILAAILIPTDQVLVLGGLHFPFVRLLIVFGMIRMLMIKMRGKKVFSGGINKLDVAVILLTATIAVAGVLLFQNGQAFIFELGVLFNAFGIYFLLRCFIRDHEDVVNVIRVLAIVVAVEGAVMLVEQLTKGWNPYSLLGGARAQVYAADMARDGNIRSMGSFGHTILAGVFGAVAMPLFVGIWLKERKYRGSAILGLVGATAMVVASHSSTPLIGYLTGILGLCLWPVRSAMRLIRWGIAIALVSLQMVMKSPVWHLITRLDLSGGSSSWHRYFLIDSCIRHFGDWWLIGTSTNASWGWDMFDTANEYVQTAVNGGLLGLILLVGVIVLGFKYLGRARSAAPDKKQQLFLWSLGSALFVYTMCFLGVSLWDQSVVAWYMLLAVISAVAAPRVVQAAVSRSTALNAPAATAINPVVLPWWERPSTSQRQGYAPWRRENEFRFRDPRYLQ